MASPLISRMMLAFQAGLQFSGARDLYSVFGYPQNLTADHLLAKYKRQDLASRVVDMPPEEMWAGSPTLKTPEDAKDKWDNFAKHVSLWDKIIQADKLCAFGEYSVLFLGLPGSTESLPRSVTEPETFRYIQAYSAKNALIKEYEADPSNPRFGQPTKYQISTGVGSTVKNFVVHWSRIVHIVDRPLEGQMFGEPRMAQVYNTLDDMLKIGGGSAEMYWLTANRGMQVNVDKDMELNESDANALSDELEEFQHQLRRYIRTRGVEITPLGSDVADPRGVFEVLLSILAGSTSIPQRILVGSEAGQLASEQDRANWAEYINRRRTVFAEPYVLRPIMRHLEILGYLPENSARDATFEWPEAFHLSPLEESQTLASKARAITNLSRRNQFADPIMSDEEVRRWVGLPDDPDGTLPEAPQQPGNSTDSGQGGQDGTSGADNRSPSTLTAGGQSKVGRLLAGPGLKS